MDRRVNSPSELLHRYQLKAKKRWGQCFLHDPQIVNRILDASGIVRGDFVIEIGAGLGVLTKALAFRSTHVFAIERDPDLVRVLMEEFKEVPNVEIFRANALTFDYDKLPTQQKVIGNLPYNISSAILFKLLESRQKIQTLTLMLQKEVVQRLVAQPGNKSYGIPSVLCQQHADIRLCFHVGRGAFYPAPRVDSTVVHLTIRDKPMVDVSEALFGEVVKAAFSQRRKTLVKSLTSRFSLQHISEALNIAELNGKRRAETLTIWEFGELTRAIERIGNVSKTE